MLDKIFGKLRFGWVGCPNCNCLNPITTRLNYFSKTKCMCCKQTFKVGAYNFHEERLKKIEYV